MMKSSIHGYFSLLCLAAAAAVVVGVITTSTQEEECKAVSCPDSGGGGPLIRFPFWLEGHQPKRCGYPHPNFQLSCSAHSNTTTTTTTTVLELIHSVNFNSSSSSSSFKYIRLKYRVLKIDYALQKVHVSLDYESVCLPSSPPAVNNLSSNTPPPPPPPLLMNFDDSYYGGSLGLWNCSSWNYGIKNSGSDLEWLLIGCLSGHAYKVVATTFQANDASILTSCEKMYDVDDDFAFYTFGEEPQIQWATPSCEKCEAQGNICRLKNNSTDEDFQIECSPPGKGTSTTTWANAAVVVAGILLLVLVISSVLYLIIRLRKKKEDQKQIEKFLEDYKALKPSRFSYTDVKKITDNFKDKLGEGGYGTVYKGNICNEDNGNNNSISVVFQLLSRSFTISKEIITIMGKNS